MSAELAWPTDRETLIRRLQSTADDEASMRSMIPRGRGGVPERSLQPPPGTPPPRRGAVLVLLYPYEGDWLLPLTVRTAALRQHSGEVSLPGGRFDEGDGTLERTALREAWEELGIPPEQVEMITSLHPVWIPVSNFLVLPVVGLATARPPFKPGPGEVALLVEASLRHLTMPEARQTTMRVLRGSEWDVPFFAVGNHQVWGATALILAQLVNRVQGAGRDEK